MRRILLAVSAVLASLGSNATALAAEATIHGIQSPAWVERPDRIIAARPGFQLSPSDQLRTGAGGRIELDLADGSRFQIGERADVTMESLAMAQDERGEFLDSVINVLKGAFRYTTKLVGRDRRRDLRIRAGTATIGIRGTDVWGAVSADGRSMMVLLEGSVTVDMPGEQMTVATPMMAMLMQGDTHREQMATMAQLPPLAAQTDMRPEAAMMMMEGGYALVVMSLQDMATAERLVATLDEAGYPASIRTVDLAYGRYHRVVLDHLPDAHHAAMLAAELAGQYGISGTWVTRQ